MQTDVGRDPAINTVVLTTPSIVSVILNAEIPRKSILGAAVMITPRFA